MNRFYTEALKKTSLFGILLLNFCVLTSGCAYRLGSPDRTLPGGYKQISIPMFKNLSQEVGIEVYYTNSLIQEFERSKIARVVDPNLAEAVIEGEIESVTYTPSGQNQGLTTPPGPNPPSTAGTNNAPVLPTGTVLAAQYQILVTVKITVKRNSDKSILWTGSFNGERTYIAPQVLNAVINTVNPLYNLSARRQNIQVLSGEMMQEAHNRITENF
jgi:hypothetical protein